MSGTLRYTGMISGRVNDRQTMAFHLDAVDGDTGELILLFCGPDREDCRSVVLPPAVAFAFLAAVSPPLPPDDEMERAA